MPLAQIIPIPTAYPKQNLFVSPSWLARLEEFGTPLQAPILTKRQGITWAALGGTHLSDFEPWISELSNYGVDFKKFLAQLSKEKADILVLRKLVPETLKDCDLQQFGNHELLPYSHSPYLNLTESLQPKKDSIQDILRTEKKITREFGNLELHFAQTQEERELWFKTWSHFKLVSGHFSEQSIHPFKSWTTQKSLPNWMKLVTLKLHLRPTEKDPISKTVALAAGLFYEHDGVFYCYSPAMNNAPEWRRFGPGKLLTQKLIENAISKGLHTFDFLQGDHGYKYHWNPKQRQLYQCFIPLTLKGKIYLKLKKTGTQLFRKLNSRRNSSELTSK